ncbi:sialic acid-binding Ig-like lectin 5 [Eleutherodactylus coqui]|uniref:sialic acid-binding Ig-like lectin 5 n=1 Tax=Eleutherodactylus coqui TaxID=57060 RepID=UPI0034627A83
MDQRSALFIAFLLEGLQNCAATYNIAIPQQLWALKHSCVIIPCSYSYSNPKQSSGSILGIWHHGINENFKDFIKSSMPQNHVSFIGDLGDGDCSIKIHNVQRENVGTYKFRVEMNHFKYSYKSVVQLNVLDDPPSPIFVFPEQTIPEATKVSLRCSTTYTCSSDLANLVWSSNEEQPTGTRTYQDGVWKVESTQVFQVKKNHDGMSFSCHASYNSGAKSQVITRNLRITYKPEILQNSQCKRILNAIYCECAVIAKPTANITWHGTDVNATKVSIKSSSNGSKTISRLEGAGMPSGDIWCTASNTEGSMSQNLTIHEAPQIIQESHCNKSRSALYCECAATANPAANITWHSTDFTDVIETSGFSINQSSNGSKTVSKLEGAVMPPEGIWCKASNMEGSATHKLPVHDKPEILLESHCTQNLRVLYCQCVVLTYNSSVAIIWGVNDHPINQTVDGYTMTTSTNGSTTLATIEGTITFSPGKFWCSARNKGGTELSNLLLHVNWTQPALIAGGILAFLILCIIGAVFAIKKCRSQEKKTLKQNTYILTGTKHDNMSTNDGMVRYHTTKDKKDVCEAVLYEESENHYMNSRFQNKNDNEDSKEVYTAVLKEEEETDENEEEGIYANY